MYCSNCGGETNLSARYCGNCGSVQPGFPAEAPVVSVARPGAGQWQTPEIVSSAAVGFPPQVEDKGRRVIAFLIDVLPLLALALIHLLPIIGWMIYGFLHACYWLLRDYAGASLGKTALGAYVTSEDGSPATTRQRILRNVTLAVPGILGMIPLIGIIFEAMFAFVIFGGEALLLLATGRRLGDRIAGTTVFRKGVDL